MEQNQIKEIEKSIEKNQNSIKTILTDVFTSYKNRGDLELPEWIKRELQKYDVYQENDEKEIIYEAADLTYHTLVALCSKNISPDRIKQELAKRFGMSGIEEKNNRKAK